ncbi:MAG: RNA-guided pseudouridylation complex pseudouridine synthase subunit Cbf5, partial [Thermoplasmata archaeon]|nr:RNA-guided pseudouridylation complex pseudouridine synthase subunit Cbf5 [Thermoplasmata archaeon]
EDTAVTLHDLKDGYTIWKEYGDEKEIRKCILPVENLVAHLPKIVVRDSAVDALCHGASLALPGVVEVDTEIKRGNIVAVMTLKGELIMIGESLMTTEEIVQRDSGICVSPERVIMKKGTYPPLWKKT